MSSHRWIGIASLVAATGVLLGAFGAHALKERLEAAGELANWQTGVRYQMWHALALAFVALLSERRRVPGFVPWAFLVGTACFSGSIYLLALRLGTSYVWPFTPLGGTLLIGGWLVLAASALRFQGPED